MDCSPPGSSVRGILQARILEWFAISFSRGSSSSRDWTQVSCTAGRFFCVCVCSLLTIIYPVMQNSNSNKKTTLQDLRRGWGLCPNSSLHENPVATHTKKASWGRTDSRIPTSLVRKLQLQFNKRQAQAHKASIPLRGQSSGPQWVFHMLFFTTAPTLCLVCAGAETHISSCLWSCKTAKNIKKCLFFF